MHILLIHQIFVTPNEGGGTRHYELARYLVQKGHRVSVIASSIDYLTGMKKDKKRETREGVEIVYASAYQSLHKSFFHRAFSFISFALSSFLEAFRIKNVDVVWGTSPPLFQSLTTLLIAQLKRRPFVFEVRDLWVDFARELGVVNNGFLVQCMKVMEKLLYRFSRKIIVNSPGFIPFIERYVQREKIFLVPNAVITNDFAVKETLQGNFRNQHNLNGKFIAMYLGNIGVANDIEVIISAAVHLRKYIDIIFILMGGGIKKYTFSDFIHNNNIKNILLLDSQPKSEVPKILADADVCIATLKDIPLFRTTYPNKVFDYMAAGKPTILAIDGVIRDVIEKSSGGICVKPGNSHEIAQAILAYYQDTTLRKKHGENARTYVKAHFEREKVAEELETLFKGLR